MTHNFCDTFLKNIAEICLHFLKTHGDVTKVQFLLAALEIEHTDFLSLDITEDDYKLIKDALPLAESKAYYVNNI